MKKSENFSTESEPIINYLIIKAVKFCILRAYSTRKHYFSYNTPSNVPPNVFSFLLYQTVCLEILETPLKKFKPGKPENFPEFF